jgi:AraC-like DNA-binding protein
MSPLEYIKVRRLNAARRRALVNAVPSVCAVAHIATNNGFHHLGRFSVAYRSYFGESPSETLVAMNTPVERVM